ncbi:MAG: hypothetical protein CVT64_01540 [Actinobacteria bacterium HGW-Actinobacteria-4]|nr:MAG: hypothetical protein CVT64_01540 [Actinobacteria bacterium HGW-Actinobacteria-4]
MLQRLGIRGKILAVVAVPIMVLVLAAGLVTLQATRDLSRAQNVEQLLDVIDAAATLTNDLQDERWNAVNYLHSYITFSSRVSSAVVQLNDTLGALDEQAETSAAVAAVVNDVRAILEGGAGTPALTDLRTARDVPRDADGWFVWPAEDAVARVTADYATMAAALDAVRRNTPESLGISTELARVTTLVGQEGNVTGSLLTVPATFQQAVIDSAAVSALSERRFVSIVDSIADIPDNTRVLVTARSVTRKADAGKVIREGIPSILRGPAVVNTWYADIIGDLTALANDVAATAGEPQLTSTLQGYAAMQTLVEKFKLEALFTERLLRAQEFQTGESEQRARIAVETDLALESAQRLVDPLLSRGERVPDYGASATTTTGDQVTFVSTRQFVSDGLTTSLQGAQVQGWESKVNQEIAVHLPIRAELQIRARDLAQTAQQATLFTTILTAAGAVIIVIASFLIALLIARRIVGPLRRLTTTATAVRQELPRLVERVALPGETVDVSEVQIPVESSDEVGRLAEAFNSVNAATLAIAGEQAALRGSISEMFVNVARRDQVLLNRQLASIDEMERTEDNPNTLTKLFALDHLATRMRRNSESLLVLAGIDTGRRLRRPMPLSDVIRTASSEIELYERVQLELDADPAMVGHSALTAAHLFAELLENATVFSDPGTPVVVRTTERDGNFIVEVVDGGIGMTPEELQEANNRVASTAASEILGAQRLGLFVVGRIARRVGARVEIQSKEGSGTTAIVTMPPTMFDLTAEVDSTHTRDSTVNTELRAPSALVSHTSDDELMDDVATGATPAHAAPVDAPIGVGSYQPIAIAKGGESSIDDLIAADAAAAPSGHAADPASLIDGAGATGLPTRRKKSGEEAEQGPVGEPIMGLPARATAAQMSALEADAPSGFTPAVAANEVAPQTAEARASMFRGFRPRGEAAESTVGIEPDAESLGQASRRGAVAPDEIPLLEEDDVDRPSYEPEPEPEVRPALAVDPADPRDTAAPVVQQSPLISTGYDQESTEFDSAGTARFSGLAADAMVVPQFDDDDDYEPAAMEEPPVREPEAEHAPEPVAGVEHVSLGDEPSAPQPAPEPVVEHVANPFPAGLSSAPATSGPSIDDLIAGDGTQDADSNGFFGRLFGRGKKEMDGAASTAPITPAVAPNAFAPDTSPQPAAASPSYSPPEISPEPSWETAAIEPEPASATDDSWQRDVAVQNWDNDAYAAPASAPMSITPAESLTPYNPGRPGTAAPVYSADQLANPEGWETAGASALEAAQPDVSSTYIPVVDIQPAPMLGTEDGPDITSEVFSELSSLSAERPKVQKTRAGLAKRRAEDAPPVEVKKIEAPVEAKPANRDPDQMRTRFSSFYSGTQRARKDVAELDKRTQPASAKD